MEKGVKIVNKLFGIFTKSFLILLGLLLISYPVKWYTVSRYYEFTDKLSIIRTFGWKCFVALFLFIILLFFIEDIFIRVQRRKETQSIDKFYIYEENQNIKATVVSVWEDREDLYGRVGSNSIFGLGQDDSYIIPTGQNIYYYMQVQYEDGMLWNFKNINAQYKIGDTLQTSRGRFIVAKFGNEEYSTWDREGKVKRNIDSYIQKGRPKITRKELKEMFYIM